MPSLRRNKTETPIAIALLLLVASACSQTKTAAKAPPSTESYTQPLPQDQGTAGLQQELRRLNTTARLMMVVAHPDDEDGGMLTLESRGQGVSTLLLTLNRGEGGQNKLGSNLFDVLGVLRTLELTAAEAKLQGAQFAFAAIPLTYPQLNSLDFHSATMRALFRFAYECAQAGRLWRPSVSGGRDEAIRDATSANKPVRCPIDENAIE